MIHRKIIQIFSCFLLATVTCACINSKTASLQNTETQEVTNLAEDQPTADQSIQNQPAQNQSHEEQVVAENIVEQTPVVDEVSVPLSSPAGDLPDEILVSDGLLRGSYLLEGEDNIIKYFQKKQSPLLDYRGRWIFGDQVNETTGSDIIATMSNLPLPTENEWRAAQGYYARVQGNPEIFLTYLQWRWHLLEPQELTSEQIDQMVQITTDAEPILSEQLKWLLLTLNDRYTTVMGDHLGVWNYDDHAETRQVLSEVLTELTGDPDALDEFMQVYYQLFPASHDPDTLTKFFQEYYDISPPSET